MSSLNLSYYLGMSQKYLVIFAVREGSQALVYCFILQCPDSCVSVLPANICSWINNPHPAVPASENFSPPCQGSSSPTGTLRVHPHHPPQACLLATGRNMGTTHCVRAGRALPRFDLCPSPSSITIVSDLSLGFRSNHRNPTCSAPHVSSSYSDNIQPGT